MSNIDIPQEQIAEFCQRWKITEFALFGSALSGDLHSNSDIDVLVTFAPDAAWTLFDHVEMQDELSVLFGRKVDLVSRRGIERSRNDRRRRAILESARPIYVAS